jgi:predicted amidohydrolase
MKKIRLALSVQKSIPGEFDKNLCATIDDISQAALHKAEIVIFPEMNLTGYMAGRKIISIAQPVDEQLIQTLSNAADKFDISILTGLAELGENHRIYATHLVFQPGSVVEYYRKIHTAPNEKAYFSPGNSVKVFQNKNVHFGIQLCYDAHFPELSTAMALKQADILIIPHASPRGSSQEKYQSWMRHLTARAFDNGVFVAALNQTGNNTKDLEFPGLALLIGPDGNIVSKFIDPKEKIHYVDVDLAALDWVRSHKMRYFLPNRRPELFGQ